MSALITPINAQTKIIDQSTQIPIEDPYLTTLPMGFMPFEEFEKEFALGNISTEQLHPITKHLSQVMHKSIPNGMELLLKIDENVVKGLESFIPSITTFAPFIAEVSQGGRIFLVGSGSKVMSLLLLCKTACVKS
jgi:hypothetical protein